MSKSWAVQANFAMNETTCAFLFMTASCSSYIWRPSYSSGEDRRLMINPCTPDHIDDGVYNGRSDLFYFARRVEPHEIVGCARNGTCVIVSRTSHKEFFDAFLQKWQLRALHLGTNAVRLRNGLHAAVLHGVSAVSART